MLAFRNKQSGFTIVELLIVIVVIGILAAITIVAYNGVQTRARDTQIKDTVAKVAKAIQIWAINHDQLPAGSGYGTTTPVSNGVCTSTSTGGFAGKGAYACTLDDMLQSDNLIPASLLSSLPANKMFSSWIHTLMFYQCGSGSRTFALYYYLENPSAEDLATINTPVSGCPHTVCRDSYGMRGVKILNF